MNPYLLTDTLCSVKLCSKSSNHLHNFLIISSFFSLTCRYCTANSDQANELSVPSEASPIWLVLANLYQEAIQSKSGKQPENIKHISRRHQEHQTQTSNPSKSTKKFENIKESRIKILNSNLDGKHQRQRAGFAKKHLSQHRSLIRVECVANTEVARETRAHVRDSEDGSLGGQDRHHTQTTHVAQTARKCLKIGGREKTESKRADYNQG